MELLDTKTGPRNLVPKSILNLGNRGKRGKMELLVTENRPEDRVGKIDFEHLEIVESVEKWSSWSPKTSSRTGLEKSMLNTFEIVESVEKWSSWSPKTSSRNGAVKPQRVSGVATVWGYCL